TTCSAGPVTATSPSNPIVTTASSTAFNSTIPPTPTKQQHVSAPGHAPAKTAATGARTPTPSRSQVATEANVMHRRAYLGFGVERERLCSCVVLSETRSYAATAVAVCRPVLT